jgi:hypothetical protein
VIPRAAVKKRKKKKKIHGDSTSRGGDGVERIFSSGLRSLPVKITGGLGRIDSVVRILTD